MQMRDMGIYWFCQETDIDVCHLCGGQMIGERAGRMMCGRWLVLDGQGRCEGRVTALSFREIAV